MARKNPNIKSANTESTFTSHEIMELRRCAQDPVYFISTYVKVQTTTDGIVPFELRPYQINMIKAYQSNRFSVVLSARQTGKEQPHSAKIAIPSGWTTMGEISIGDNVLTPDGQVSTVVNKFPQGIKDVYKITFDDGSVAECGLDHLWTVYIRNKWVSEPYGHYIVQQQTLTLRQIIEYMEKNASRKNKQNYNVRIPVVSKVNFVDKVLPLDPYVLGLLLGDGGLSINHRVSFTTADSQIVENLQESLIQYDAEFKHNIKNNIFNGNIISKIPGVNNIVQIIKDLNLTNTASDTKFIPELYKTASHEQRLALLQGLMDTDGTVSKRGNKRTISFCTTSVKLRDDVQDLIRSLGGKSTYYIRYPKNPNHKTAYDVYVSLPNPKDCFRLKRKQDWCHDVWHNNVGNEKEIRRTIKSIDKVRTEESSCILIDNPNHLYITDNYTVTHNSVTAAAFILWYAIFHFDKTILIASNKNTNAMEMIFRIRTSYENLPMWLKPGVQDDGWNKHNLGFDNGTRIISEATSETSGRGLSISLLYLDEFAFVNPSIQKDFWTSISPTLSTGGSCIMTSTPNGDVDIFATIWRGAQVKSNGFFPIRVYWDEPPGRDEAFKKDEIGRIGERLWLQEYECEFLSSDALLVSSLVLANLTTELENVRPVGNINDVTFWEEIQVGGTYLIGVDPATGSGEDYSVITVFEFPTLRQIAEYRSNTMSTNDLYGVLKNMLVLFQQYHTIVYFSVENNGVGEGIISLYEADENPPDNAEFVSEEGRNRRGMTTTSRTKMKACVNMKEMIERRKMEIKSPILLSELKMYVRSKGAYAAQPGSTDDSISAVLIITRLMEEIATYDQVAFDKLYVGDFERWGDDDWDGYEGEYDEKDEGMPMYFS